MALLKDSPENNDLVTELFLATLNRPPTIVERKTVIKSLAGQRDEAFSDLFWALLNSKEFAFNH